MVTELAEWFNLIEQIHLLQMAELQLLELIWAASTEREDPWISTLEIVWYTEVASKAVQGKEAAQSNSASVHHSQSDYRN